MKLKDIFNLICECDVDIHKVNPEFKYDPLVLHDSWFNNEKDLENVLEKYGEYPVVSLTCLSEELTIVITIDNP